MRALNRSTNTALDWAGSGGEKGVLFEFAMFWCVPYVR